MDALFKTYTSPSCPPPPFCSRLVPYISLWDEEGTSPFAILRLECLSSLRVSSQLSWFTERKELAVRAPALALEMLGLLHRC